MTGLRAGFERRRTRGVRALLLTGIAALAVAAPAGAASAHHPAPPARPASAPDLGPNVYVFTPSMPQSQIQSTVDAIAAQQVGNQFGTQRYALLFEPGTYGSAADPLTFPVGYYTEVAGLGATPGDVTINGSVDVYNQCEGSQTNCTALDNFWRSLSNLTINVAGGSGCQSATDFWAVSQASPMRRVHINGKLSLMDYCTGSPDYASGGFIADSAFSGGTVINGSQQQFFVRNSDLDGWSNGVWNQVFSGDIGAPAQDFGVPGANQYTTLPTSPVTEEEPFLQMDASGAESVFVPAVQHNSAGTSWQGGTTAGHAIPIADFFIATPGSSVADIDRALDRGQNLILTPGVYDLSAPIVVRRRDTVVLGLGFPTLVPQNGTPAMIVDGRGVKLSGTIFDAGPRNSQALLQIGGPRGVDRGGQDDPTLVQDVFFRIGGATPGRATNSLVVDGSNVILDDVWAWRADHGNGVGWNENVAAHGVVVGGDHVIAYGLAVEHYEQSQVVWNGEDGEDIFFQSEMPYDVPSQAAWMESPTQDGYPAFQLGDRVSRFTGYGMGAYSNFDLGQPIEASMAFQSPTRPGDQFHDLLTVFLNGSGGIRSVIDGTGAPVSAANPSTPSDVVSYP